MKLYYETSLSHHGIKGQKWGVRRFQNEDGSLTPRGMKRYENNDGVLTRAGKSKLYKDIKKERKAVEIKERLKLYRTHGRSAKEIAPIIANLKMIERHGVETIMAMEKRDAMIEKASGTISKVMSTVDKVATTAPSVLERYGDKAYRREERRLVKNKPEPSNEAIKVAAIVGGEMVGNTLANKGAEIVMKRVTDIALQYVKDTLSNAGGAKSK